MKTNARQLLQENHIDFCYYGDIFVQLLWQLKKNQNFKT